MRWASVSTVPDTISRIKHFAEVSSGWRYGQGEPAKLPTIENALKLNEAATSAALKTNAFLGIEGEVRVTVYHETTYLQFTIEENGVVEFVREEGQIETDRQILTVKNALLLLENFEIEVWLSSVSSTARTTISIEEFFKTLPLKLPEAVRVFRSSSGIAPLELALQSADI